MEKSKVDQFANIATIEITENAANTLTYKKLETGIAIFDKVAWVVSRVEFFTSSLLATIFDGTNDSLYWAITVSNSLTTLVANTQKEPTVIYGERLSRQDLGAAASGFFVRVPFVIDYSTLPGGGLLIPPSPLYGAVQGVGLTAATYVVIKMYYTNLSLTPDQYWELVESRRYISS